MDKKYQSITTIEDLKKYIGKNREIAFAFKTAPHYQFRKEADADVEPVKSYIVGCSFSVSEGSGVYVPLAHRLGANMDAEEFFGFLKEFLTNKNIVKISHNIAFQAALAYGNGILIQPPVYDTRAASQLTLKTDNKFRSFEDSDLDVLVKGILEKSMIPLSKVTGKKFMDQMNADDPNVAHHCAFEADCIMALYKKFNEWFDKHLPQHQNIVETIESPVEIYLGIMKQNGLFVDFTLMVQYKMETDAELEKIYKEIERLSENVDLGANCSSQAFRHYLYETLKLPVLKTTKNHMAALDSTTISLLKAWCDANRPTLLPLLELVEKYRKYYQIKRTFIDGYMKHLIPTTGCLHPNIRSMGASTGRMSCHKPNLQNMPRKSNDPIGIRNLIKAPEGSLILSLDFSQIELRFGTFYCKDKVMMETYQNNGDIHAATTSVIFDISADEAQDKHNENYKERRTIAKSVNFGVFYGLYPNGLKDILLKAGISKTQDECKEIIDNIKKGYPGLTVWQNKTKAEVAERKYCETWSGRRRYLPEIVSEDWNQKSTAERQALNHLIQGTAADVIKLAMVRILDGLSDRPWLKPILQIHDELVFVVPKEKLEEAVMFVRSCMEEKPFAEFDIPLIAEAAAGPNFGEMEELDR